jgi:exonuclease SbcC
MKIEHIKFRNFGSYGNREMELTFSELPAFYLVQGRNGHGKSTLSDVIKFGIFGKLENKKLKDVANRMNKHAEVRIELTTRKGKVIVERGVEPGYFRLYLNGKEIDKAGKRSVQEFLEEELLEMPFYVFSNTLSLSINDFKSFIRMTNYDKRAIVDKIFGLQVLNQMREVLKAQTKRLKEMVDSLESSARAFTRSLTNSEEVLRGLVTKIQESQGEKSKELEEKRKKLNAFLVAKKSKEAEISSKLEEGDAMRRAIEKAITGDAQLVKESKQKIALYESSKCPTCLSDLTTDFHKENLKQYQATAKEAEDRCNEKKAKLEKLTGTIRKIQEAQREVQRQMHAAEAQLSVVVREASEIMKQSNADDQTSALAKIVEETKKNIAESQEERNQTAQRMNFFSLIEEIVGDKGVKQLAIKSILPSLNSEIHRLVMTLGLEHRITFDEEFNAKIVHFGTEVSADTLSTGESKKVDFAVLLAFIRLLKIKYPGANVLFLDEIFSSVDGDGIYHILKILRETVKEYEMNIFVISHYPLTYTEFDYKIEIDKNNGFSSFTVERVI